MAECSCDYFTTVKTSEFISKSIPIHPNLSHCHSCYSDFMYTMMSSHMVITWWSVWGYTSTEDLCDPCPSWSPLHRPPPPTAGGIHCRVSLAGGEWALCWNCQWLWGHKEEENKNIYRPCTLLCVRYFWYSNCNETWQRWLSMVVWLVFLYYLWALYCMYLFLTFFFFSLCSVTRL